LAWCAASRLAGAEDRLRPARAQRAVVVDPGEAEILERQRGQARQRGLDAHVPELDVVEHPPEDVSIHSRGA
jgi:hypothetical protein